MSQFLDRLTFFRKQVGTFAAGHGVVTNEPRDWEDGYRKRWQHDKIVRSTHGVNCTGSCSWKIYVNGGIVTWDVPESADWYNAGFLMLWGSNVPQIRTPDAHFYTEVRYKGTKSVVVSPDYAEATKFADLWLHPKQGTDAALPLAWDM